MKLTFWGVRGSVPVPGPDTCRWGGNSSCVEVRAPGMPPLVLDCGTGARNLGARLLEEGVNHVQVLLSHLHTDHLFGFPFFGPVFREGCRIDLGVPAFSEDEAQERVARYLNGTFHPLRLRELLADLRFVPVRPDAARVFSDGWEVATLRLLHPGGSIGYRVTHQGRSLAYLTDTGPFAAPGEGLQGGQGPGPAELRLVKFVEGCDLVVFDTMFSRDQCHQRLHWGHSFPEYAIGVCRWAKVGRLILFHHAPSATDEELDQRALAYGSTLGLRVEQAREGETWALD